MTVEEAREIVREFDENKLITDEDEFMFIEAMAFLINEEKNPKDMLYLGGYYYEQKKFDLALKYYEMAATMDYDPAYECLGYIWYYGRTGERDFRKAFEYFSKLMDKGHLVATYKVADMYKNGYYVDKDYDKYVSIIESLYPRVKSECRRVFDPIPEVYTRLARIRKAQGKIDEAVALYLNAKNVLERRIEYNAFFGNLNIMKWLIDDLYTMKEFDYDDFDFFDLYYLLKKPHKIRMITLDDNLEEKVLVVESVIEESACVICYDGRWYRDRDAFFADASYEGEKLTHCFVRFYFELAD